MLDSSIPLGSKRESTRMVDGLFAGDSRDRRDDASNVCFFMPPLSTGKEVKSSRIDSANGQFGSDASLKRFRVIGFRNAS